MPSSNQENSLKLEGSDGTLYGLKPGTVVYAANHLAGVQSSSGDLVPVEQLGPGIVAAQSNEGEVKVYWTQAEFESWMVPHELRLAGAGARLITVRKFDAYGKSTLSSNKVVSNAGLHYNWLVEVGARQILRAVRSDGCVWTFDWYPIFDEVHPQHTILTPDYQMTDDEAEALTAAELAMARPTPKRALLQSLRWRVFARY